MWLLFNLIWLFVLSEPILTSSPLPARRYKSLFEVILKALFPVDIISVPLLDSIDIPALSPFNVISFANKSPLALILPDEVILPLNKCVSAIVSPKILDPSVLTIEDVTILEVSAVTVKLSTVISVAVKEVTPMLEANASESTPPSFIRSVSEFISIVASSTLTDNALPPPPANPSPATPVAS